MSKPFRSCGIMLFLVALSFAKSDERRDVHRSFLEQRGCPMSAISQRGSALVLKNVSDKRIVSYVLACFSRAGKRYEPNATFDVSEVPVDPGGFTSEGGFDATPLNICRSRKSLIGVSEATFADGSSWKSPLTRRGMDHKTDTRRWHVMQGNSERSRQP